MSDKIVAGLVTAAAVGPICAVCILGPTFVFSWVSGFFAGLSPVVATGLAIIAAILVYGLLRWRRTGASRPGAAPCAPEGTL